MDASRRSFIQSTFALLCGPLIPALVFSSCRSAGSSPLVLDYIGKPELFDVYRVFFRKLKHVDLQYTSLEQSLESPSGAVLLDVGLSLKPTYAILLLEQQKDLICTYPLAAYLREYNRIQEFLLRYERILGMVNPIIFYPSIRSLKKILVKDKYSLTEVLISAHPAEMSPGYRVDGIAGTAQMLQRMVTYFSGKYPVSLQARENETGGIRQISLDYSSFRTRIIFDARQIGWNMELRGHDFRARSDHTGLLAVDDEPRPRIESAPVTWEKSMIHNLDDFTDAVRNRTKPWVSSLDALASVILNRAVEDSLELKQPVKL